LNRAGIAAGGAVIAGLSFAGSFDEDATIALAVHYAGGGVVSALIVVTLAIGDIAEGFVRGSRRTRVRGVATIAARGDG
jgi:glucose/arabinose dehydrogenase